MAECSRCAGTGRTIFRHVESGVCFCCEGSGVCDGRCGRETAPIVGAWDPYYHLRSIYSAARSHMRQGTGCWPLTDDEGGTLSLLTSALNDVDAETARKARAAFARLGCGSTLDLCDAIAKERRARDAA